jgi:hypothetical protein
MRGASSRGFTPPHSFVPGDSLPAFHPHSETMGVRILGGTMRTVFGGGDVAVAVAHLPPPPHELDTAPYVFDASEAEGGRTLRRIGGRGGVLVPREVVKAQGVVCVRVWYPLGVSYMQEEEGGRGRYGAFLLCLRAALH